MSFAGFVASCFPEGHREEPPALALWQAAVLKGHVKNNLLDAHALKHQAIIPWGGEKHSMICARYPC